jgi:hypothetical protein
MRFSTTFWTCFDVVYNVSIVRAEYPMKTALSIACLAVMGLSACGADVATATVTAAKLKAEEAKQGQAQMERVQKALDEAQRLNQQRMDAIENADAELQGDAQEP